MFSGRWVCHAIADGNLSGNPGGSLLVVPGYAGIFPAYVVECCTGVEQTFDLVVGDAEGRSGVRDYEIRYVGKTVAGVCDYEAQRYQARKEIRRS